MNGDAPNPLEPLPSPDADDDRSWAARLLPPSDVPFGSRWKNLRLQGTGLNPILIYGSFLAVFVLWIVGACLLSFLGLIVMLLGVAALFAVTTYYSRRQQMREMRTGMGFCPGCGYDLRESATACPECNTPVPDEILRRRRAMERIRALAGNVRVASVRVARIEPGREIEIDPLSRRAPTPELPPIPLIDEPSEQSDGAEPKP